MRNAILLIDLDICDRGYSPTQWQRGLLPKEFQPKVKVIYAGVDTNLRRRRSVSRKLGDEAIPNDMRIVNSVSHGLEAMRAF